MRVSKHLKKTVYECRGENRYLATESQKTEVNCVHKMDEFLGNTACGRGHLKCDGTRAETRFRLSAKRTSHLIRGGGSQFSRLLAAEVCASAVVMLDTRCSEVVRRVLATHSICQFSLHFPTLRHRVPSHFNWSLNILNIRL